MGALVRARSFGRDAVAEQLLLGEADGHTVFDLAAGGIGFLVGVAAVLKAHVLAVAQQGSVELQGHVQREGVDEPVHVPGGLAVFLEEGAHQGFLGLDVGLAADDGAAELLADVLQVVLACLGHGEVVLHAEQDGVHLHDLFQDVHLEVAVLTAGHGNGAVVAAGAVAAAVFVAQGFKFLPAGIPVHLRAALVVEGGAANALGIECDAGPGVGHGAFFTVFHGSIPSLEVKACAQGFLCRRFIIACPGPYYKFSPGHRRRIHEFFAKQRPAPPAKEPGRTGRTNGEKQPAAGFDRGGPCGRAALRLPLGRAGDLFPLDGAPDAGALTDTKKTDTTTAPSLMS